MTRRSRGQPSHAGGDGNRGGRGGRGRGRGRGRGWNMGTDRGDIEREAQALTHTLGLSGMAENAPRGRGRGRGRTPQFDDLTYGYASRGKGNKTPRGLGFPTPPARGGFPDHTPHRRQYHTPIDVRDRPLLKPIKFVRSSTVLFQDEDEIFRPEIVDAELDDAPTASKVEQAFARANTSPSDSEDVSSNPPSGRNDDHPSRPLQPRFVDVDTMLSFDFDVSSNLPVLSWGFTEAELLASSSIGTASKPSITHILSSSSQVAGLVEERVRDDHVNGAAHSTALLSANTFKDKVQSSKMAQPTVSPPSRPVSNLEPLESVESAGAALAALSFVVDTMSALPVEARHDMGAARLAPVVSLPQSDPPLAETLSYIVDVTGDLPIKGSGGSGGSGTLIPIPDIPPVHVKRLAWEPEPEAFFIDTLGNIQGLEDVAATVVDNPLPQNTTFEEPSFVVDTVGVLPGQPPHDGESTTPIYDIPIPKAKQKKQKQKTKSDPQPSFIIDTEGRHGFTRPTKVKYPKIRSGLILGDGPLTHAPEPRDIFPAVVHNEDDEDGDDDIVVFVPPTSSNPTSLPSNFLASQSVTFSPDHIASIRPTISFADIQLSKTSLHPSARQATQSSRLNRKGRREKKRILRRRKDREAMYGSFDPDPPGGVPRVGDSDVEWGSDGPPGRKTDARRDREEISADPSGNPDDHGMDVDSGLDNASYARLVKGLLAPETVTIDDLEDHAQIRREDQEVLERGSSGDEDSAVELRVHGDVNDEVSSADGDAAIDGEERRIVGEDSDEEALGAAGDSEGGDESSPDSSDIDLSFRTRLAKVRSRAKRPSFSHALLTDSDGMDDTSNDGDDDNFFGSQRTWADRDEEVIAEMQDVVDSYPELFSGRSRKERKEIFKAIQNGDFDAVEDIHDRNNDVAQGNGKKKKKDGAYVPPELKDQWRKDRRKKAKYKRERAKDRMLANMDPFPSRKSGKKKDKLEKRIYDEARPAAGEITPIVDFRSLVSQIRVFLADLGGRQTMVLPSMDPASRARMHRLASCFNLNSKSTGVGSARHTTLIRTTRSGVEVDEKKINTILNWKGPTGPKIPSSKAHDRRSGERSKGLVRQRDGDVVGNKAAKIGESNIGFRLLRQMGWSEGERIGITGGLADPLTAVIKNSKLGLGASGKT